MPHTVKLPNGQFLNGISWHTTNPLFASLPFITALLHAEEDMVQILEPALKVSDINDQLSAVLIVCTLISCFLIKSHSWQHIADGLDGHQPFSDTPAVQIILASAKSMLAPDSEIKINAGSRQ